jgi:hypothetical protein
MERMDRTYDHVLQVSNGGEETMNKWKFNFPYWESNIITWSQSSNGLRTFQTCFATASTMNFENTGWDLA